MPMRAAMTSSSPPDGKLGEQRCHRLLGELLVDGGFVTPEDIRKALEIQSSEGIRLGDALVRSGRLDTVSLRAALHLQRLLDELAGRDSVLGAWLNGTGEPPEKLRSHCHIRLGELLLAESEISAQQFEKALADQQKTGKPLGELLVSAGWLSTRKLRFYLKLQKQLTAAAATCMLLFGTQTALANPPADAASGSPRRAAAGMIASGGSAGRATRNRVNLRRTASEDDFEHNLALHSRTQRLERLKQKKLERQRELTEKRAREREEARRQKLRERGVPDELELHDAVREQAERFALPIDLIYAIIQTESSFNPKARSAANAYGLMQVVPDTAGREVHRLLKDCTSRPTARQLLDPLTNLYFGTAYLRILLDYYFRDVDTPEVRIGLAVAAYNMGPGRLVNLIERKGAPRNIEALRRLLRAHAPPETQDYVDKVLNRRHQYLVFAEETQEERPA